MAKRKSGAGKRSTESARIERLGIALCESQVVKMGHIWRDKGVDYGVDGEIELIHDGRVLNQVLWVQSKAKGDNYRFAGETETGFRYLCDPDDLDYWLSGTAPVLLVCSHPESDLAWFKHLPSWFSDARRRRDRIVEFDKELDRFDSTATQRLLHLGVPKSAGVYLRPPPVPERLKTNLLTVEHVAWHVNVAPTTCRTWNDVNARMTKAGHSLFSDAVLRGGNIYTFRSLDIAPLNTLTSGPTEAIAVDELSGSEDDHDRTLITWLLNATLKELNYRDLRFHPDHKYLYFKPIPGKQRRRVHLGKGKGRAVVERYEPPGDATWKPYTRHMALHSQFVHIDGGWHLAITPTYHFTSDGYDDFPFSATQLSKIKEFERHDAVRSQTVFWARYLAGTRNLLSADDERLRFGELVELEVDRGIDDRSWKPLADNNEPDEVVKPDQASLFDLDEAS